MDYDIVVATRNRQSILLKSLQLISAQTRLPRRVVVVDASDNHTEVREIVDRVFGRTASRIEVHVETSRAGSSLQRNIGLQRVESPVVVFPDDDSLWFPDSAENLMRVYERDDQGLLGCVAFAVSAGYPTGSLDDGGLPYEIEARDRVARNLRNLIGTFEERLLPDPINPGGLWMHIWGAKVSPDWLPSEEAELCGPVFGYRMSFRTSVIRGIGGFDERLGRYAMFEDSDATIGALSRRLNVIANRARVHHYRAPGERVSGREFGLMAILNRTYVVCKHSGPGSLPRRLVRKYLRYKVARYIAQSYSGYGRTRLQGAITALSRADELLGAPIEEVPARYLAIRQACISG